MTEGSHDHGRSPLLTRLWQAIASLPRPRWAAAVIALACVAAVTLAPQPFWENDLGALTPVPRELLERDRVLRAELGTADTRHLLVVEGTDLESVLGTLEALNPQLEGLVASGAIGAYDHAARYVPSTGAQRARQSQLPSAAALRADLEAAAAGTPFRPAAFAPFLAEVEAARTLPPLTFEQARAMPTFGSRLDALVPEHSATVAALVTFSGVRDVAALAALAPPGAPVTLLDVRSASESLVAGQRSHLLASLAVGGLLLIAIVAAALRDRRRVLRVLAPLALTTLLVVALLQLAGVSLNLFHLISLILAAGLGLDYALFFEHAADDEAEQGRTLHAVLTCAGSTLMVFVLLALADLPVLRAIGAPVAIGVIANFVLALVLTRPAVSRPAR
jgi:predicted exporter